MSTEAFVISVGRAEDLPARAWHGGLFALAGSFHSRDFEYLHEQLGIPSMDVVCYDSH